MRAALPLLAGGAGAVTVAILAGTGAAGMGTVVLVMVLAVIVVPIGWRMAGERDPWLWWVATLGLAVKLAGSALRYWVLVSAYGRSGDAIGYHRRGARMAEVFRAFQIPALDGAGGEGTQVTRWITGLLYAPYEPTMLGGFLIFGSVAFLGQLLFYAAFRRAVPDGHLKAYSLFIFFMPALVFWPSSIGKESLMLFFLGLGAYGMARALDAFRPLWLVVAGAGLFGAGMIRPHIAALLAGAFLGAILVGRARWSWGVVARRLLVLGAAVVLAITSLSAFGDRYGLESGDDVDPFIGEIQRRTQQGGSAVEGGAVRSPAQLPAGTLRVLFRPLPHEAHNLQAMASAAESTILLLIVVWKLPAMIRRIRRLRTPYLLMSFFFTVGFTIAFSAVFNLGILARQRSQVLPFLLAVLVGLGWDARARKETTELPVPATVAG